MKNISIPVVFCLFLTLHTSPVTSATLLNFEDLTDQVLITSQYASTGVIFSNAIALTAGFSFNEIDFPPHSGQVVIGDDNGGIPMEFFFTTPVNDVSAWFTYSSPLTITAFDLTNIVLGTANSIGADNTGSSTQITLGFQGISRVTVSGETGNSFTMDDLRFVPEPTILELLGIGLLSTFFSRKKCNSAQ